MAGRGNFERESVQSTFASFTSLPLSSLRENEVRDRFSANNPPKGDQPITRGQILTFAIVDTEGGVRQGEMDKPLEPTKARWDTAIRAAVKREFKTLYGESFVMRRRFSIIDAPAYEIWINDDACDVNPYVAQLLPRGSRACGHSIVFRCLDSGEVGQKVGFYRSVSEVQLSKFFSDSTNEKRRQDKLDRLMERAESFSDAVSYTPGRTSPPTHRRSFSPKRSPQEQTREASRQKREREEKTKSLGHTGNNSTRFDNNDSYVSRTFNSPASIRRRKVVYVTKDTDDSLVYVTDDSYVPKPDDAIDGPTARRNRNKFMKIQTREESSTGTRRSTRIRKKSTRRR